MRRIGLVAAMSSNLYIGLDVGTQSTKALVFDLKGREAISRGSK